MKKGGSDGVVGGTSFTFSDSTTTHCCLGLSPRFPFSPHPHSLTARELPTCTCCLPYPMVLRACRLGPAHARCCCRLPPLTMFNYVKRHIMYCVCRTGSVFSPGLSVPETHRLVCVAHWSSQYWLNAPVWLFGFVYYLYLLLLNSSGLPFSSDIYGGFQKI